jgi:assimilatory nitrate reductase catalytic subunit
VFAFIGQGLDRTSPVADELTYVVPPGHLAQTVYLRAGNSSDDLVCVVVRRDGRPWRYFPVGARADTHVPLRVVEDLDEGTRLDVHVGAREGAQGWIVVDLGLLEL